MRATISTDAQCHASWGKACRGGPDARCLKVNTDAKQFAAYDGERREFHSRASFDARVSQQNLVESFSSPPSATPVWP